MSSPTRTNKDLLDEAQAHLTAGRIDAGEACAREVLARHPGNPQAHFVLALASLARDRHAEALEHMEAALRRDRVNAQFHYVAALCLAPLGRADEAMASDRRALQFRPAFAAAHLHLGRLLEQADRVAEAAEEYRRVLAANPNDPAALGRLGYCELALGRPEHGLPLVQRWIRQVPMPAATLLQLGETLVRMGHGSHAIEPLRRAVAMAPELAPAWAALGEQLYLTRDDAGALDCFDRALALDAANEQVRFLRHVVTGTTVDHPPEPFVARFFDLFAQDFDRRLRGELEYRVPEDLAAMLEAWLAGRVGLRVADLGCGTGLSGGFVRPHAALLAGVDLSEKMLEQARARGIYDELVREDIGRFLESRASGALDLVIAADVFIYVGNLDAVLRGCARALAPGGVAAFSIEHLDDAAGDFVLARTGRYAHARAYVDRLASACGLTPLLAQETVLRKEGSLPVRGHLLAFEQATDATSRQS